MNVTKRVLIAAMSAAACVFIAPPAVEATSLRGGQDDGVPVNRVVTPSDLKGLPWRSVGPANMGGRLATIAFAPGNSKVIYLGFGTGGVWKSTNGGMTFAPVFDQELTSSIGSISVCDAPVDWSGWAEEEAKNAPVEGATAKAAEDVTKERMEAGKGRIVWVGTGEGNGRNSSSWGHGVYRSTDGGSTFEHCGLADTHDVPSIVSHPNDPDVCYAAGMGHLWGANEERGLFKTTDGGKSWANVLKIDEDTGCIDVILHPSNPDIVYAAMYARRRTAWSFQSGGPEGGIYKSTDAGVTWSKLTNGLPTSTGRIGLDASRSRPDSIIAVIQSDEGGVVGDAFADVTRAGGVFRSDDAGETWTRVNSFNPRPFYFSKIHFDPTDDQRVYMLGWELYVSTDGGKTFKPGSAKTPHVDFHAIAFDPNDHQRIFIGTDGGLYESRDRGATWHFHNTMAVGQFYNVGVSMSDPYMVGGGLQDNGTWIGPSETTFNADDGFMGRAGGITNADWRGVWGGDGFHTAFDPTDSNIVYAESQGGYIGRIHLDLGITRTLHPVAREGSTAYRFNWNAPFFISPHDPKVLYLGGNRVFRMSDRGDRYEVISPDLSRLDPEKILTTGSSAESHGTIVALAESPVTRGLLWAGTDDGLVHVSTDGGSTWANVTPAAVNGYYVSKIEASHHDASVAYVSVDGHRSDFFDPILLLTTDMGKTWRSIAGDLPSGSAPGVEKRGGKEKRGIIGGPVKVIREDLVSRDVLYCGTERGVYFTYDRGDHWIRLNGETLPTVAVDDLVIHQREQDLVAGTHGRSIWILDDISPLSQMTNAVAMKSFHLFKPTPAKPRYRLWYDGLWSDTMFIAPNPPMGAVITYWVREWSDQPVKVSIKDGKGEEVASLTGQANPGFNRVVWDLQRTAKERLPNPDGLPNFLPAGTYVVEATLGEENVRTDLEVLDAPGAAEGLLPAGKRPKLGEED